MARYGRELELALLFGDEDKLPVGSEVVINCPIVISATS